MSNGTTAAPQVALGCDHILPGSAMKPLRKLLDMSSRALLRITLAVLLASGIPLANAASPPETGAPRVDHHQHLLSPQGALLLNTPKQADDVPAPVTALLRAHEAKWDDPQGLAPLYSSDAVALDTGEPAWLQGRKEVAAHLALRFAKPYQIVPLAWRGDDRQGYLSALYSRGEGVERKNVGTVAMRFVREGAVADGWRIAMQHSVFPGPVLEQPLDAERLITLLDAAGIRRAVVLSVGYWFQSPMFEVADPVRSAREENAWTATQAARYPERLVAFCSLNPISDAALELLQACVDDGRFKGLKLHFGNGRIDLTDSAHVSRVRAVFAAANAAGFAIVVHARGDDTYGARHARIVIDELLPAAPDVPVQMAHLWGGGAFAPEALAVYAEAVAAKHPATRRLIFDASDAAYGATTPDRAALIAQRMRQIGLDRMVYGSDGAFDGHPDPQASWQAFRKGIPLTDAEFATIVGNVAPYLRD